MRCRQYKKGTSHWRNPQKTDRQPLCKTLNWQAIPICAIGTVKTCSGCFGLCAQNASNRFSMLSYNRKLSISLMFFHCSPLPQVVDSKKMCFFFISEVIIFLSFFLVCIHITNILRRPFSSGVLRWIKVIIFCFLQESSAGHKTAKTTLARICGEDIGENLEQFTDYKGYSTFVQREIELDLSGRSSQTGLFSQAATLTVPGHKLASQSNLSTQETLLIIAFDIKIHITGRPELALCMKDLFQKL